MCACTQNQINDMTGTIKCCVGILEEERKEKKKQADDSAKQIKLLEGTPVCGLEAYALYKSF